MIAYTFLVVLTLVVAYFEAKEDARHIIGHKPISHSVQLRERFYMVGVITLLAMASSWLREGILTPNWACLFMPVVAWAVFTTPFRLFLNRRRKFDWRCMAPWSNGYDLLWYRVIMRRWHVEPEWLSEVKALYKTKEPVIVENIHRAGSRAYLFELSILALSSWGYFHFTNN